MIHTANAVRTLQAVAMTVGVALLLWSFGLPTFFRPAEAASITNASDTLSDSRPSQGSVHTIQFTLPNGMSIGQTFEVDFDSNFDSASLVVGDVSMTVDGNATTTAGSAGAGQWGVTGLGTDTLTFETPTDYGVASSGVLVLTIGSSTNTMIVNPAATTSYPIDIGGGASTMQDTGQVRVAIIDEVTVTASVDTSLTFSVSGVGSSQSVNGTSTTQASTPTTIPFGTLNINEIETLAQELSVATNAANGFTVTVEQTGDLDSSTGAVIDGFIDGSNTTTPTAWQSPSATVNQLNTYGHWGLTSDDTAISARTSQFSSNAWVSGSTTPIAVMGHTGPANGATVGVGTTTVGYQIEISALQEAGDDYDTTLRYIATPVF